MQEPGYVTVKDAADYLAVSIETIRRMCEAGEIPGARRVGVGSRRQWRIPRSFLTQQAENDKDKDKEERG